MTILIIGLIVFFAIHFVPSMFGVKQALVGRLGQGGYRGLFSICALVGLGLIVWGFSESEFVPVYDAPVWGRHVTMALVLLGFICLGLFHLKSRIRKAISHPMLIGVGLWALGHLFANGDLASVLLFGSFLVFSFVAIMLANAQGRVAQFEVKPAHDYIGIGVGIVLYVAVMYLHPWFTGVAVM